MMTENKTKLATLYRDQRIIALKVVDWCLEEFEIYAFIKLELSDYSKLDCWGQCYQGRKDHYTIEIAKDQTLRDFVATVVHEMVHVNQWVTDTWKGDGEGEAEELQYKLTDKLWKANIL